MCVVSSIGDIHVASPVVSGSTVISGSVARATAALRAAATPAAATAKSGALQWEKQLFPLLMH